MNKARRKAIADVQEQLRKAQEIIRDAAEQLASIKDDEEEYFDNMPEGIQAGERGEKAQAAIDNLDEALTTLEGIDEEIDGALESMDSAAE